MKKVLKIAIGAVVLACACMSAWAAPARPVACTLTLEDGSTVRATMCGDEYGRYWVGAAGEFYTEVANGTYRRVPQADVERARKAAEQERVMRSPGKKNLAPRGLVILANFLDVHFQPGNTQAEMDSALNGQIYTYHKSFASAAQYFHDQSMGQYNPQFDVVGPVQLPDSLKYYGRNTGGNGSDAKAPDMVFKACSIASQINGVNFANYDNDNDGYLDFVFIIYAGYGENDSGDPQTRTYVDSLIWAASWTMSGAVGAGKTSLPTNAPKSAYTFQGKTIGSYAYSSELNYFNTITFPTEGYDVEHPLRAGINVFCHEFSHVLGLPDLYETLSPHGTNYNKCLTPGNWNLMDVGTYNSDGYVPPAYAPMERWWLGWGAPTLLADSANITLPADNQTAYYITKNGTAATATTADTIFYVENRQQTGWDQGLPGHGMVIWRVVFASGAWSGNSMNNTADKPRYLHIAADSTYTYNTRTGLQGDAGDPFPGTKNVTEYLPFAGSPITDIQELNEEITFKFKGGADSTALDNISESDTDIQAVFALTGTYMGNRVQGLPAGIYLVRTSNGKTEKIIVR